VSLKSKLDYKSVCDNVQIKNIGHKAREKFSSFSKLQRMNRFTFCCHWFFHKTDFIIGSNFMAAIKQHILFSTCVSLSYFLCHSSPTFKILLYFSQYFNLHLITDCRCLWNQPLLLLNPEFHMNNCDTARDGQQQPRRATQTIERCSPGLLLTICFFLFLCLLSAHY